MSWAAAAFVIGAFFWLLQLLRVPARAADVVTRSRQALQTMRASASKMLRHSDVRGRFTVGVR